MSNGYWVSKDGLRIPKSDNAQRKQWDASYLARLKDYFGSPDDDFEPALIPVSDIEPSHHVDSSNPRTTFYTRLYKLGEKVPPVLVTQGDDGRYQMRDGNHRHEAAIAAGVTHIPGLIHRPKKATKPRSASPHVFTGTKVKKLGTKPMKKSEGFHDILDLSKHERETPPQLPQRIIHALWAIRQPGVLTDELRQPQYRSNPDPFAGHCFVATNALFHLIDGAKTGWSMKCIHKEHMEGLADDAHWFLQHDKTGHIIDPTADQFDSVPPYEKAVSKGTSQTGDAVGKPTQRAEKVIKRAKAVMSEAPKEYLGTLQHDGKEWYIKPPEMKKAEEKRVSLDDANGLYDWFHISHQEPDENGQFRAEPRVPKTAMSGEETRTPRICVGPSIHHCVAGLLGAGSLWDSNQEPDPDYPGHVLADMVKQDPAAIHQFRGMHVYGTKRPRGLIEPSPEQVPDAPMTGEAWLTKPNVLEHVGKLTAVQRGNTIPSFDHHLVKAEPHPIASAAFRHRASGKVLDTGPVHMWDELEHEDPQGTERDWEDGFLDRSGNFLTREEAGKLVGLDRPQNPGLDSDDPEASHYGPGNGKFRPSDPERGAAGFKMWNSTTGQMAPLDPKHVRHLDKAESSPEFQSWFSGSKAVDHEGKPLRFFHGTSKDQDFHTFKVGQRGAWFTDDPEEASLYAEENDSKGHVLDRDTMRLVPKHTASRVIPVHLSIKNPYKPSLEEFKTMKWAPNYAIAQREMFNRARMAGHDGADMGAGIWVAFNPKQIKSVFNTKPTQHPAIHKAEPLAKAIVPGVMTSASDNSLAQEWDYSHLLPQHARDEGYRVRLRVNRYKGSGYDGRGHFTIFANQTVDGRTRPAGTVTAQYRDNNVSVHESRVEEKDRSKARREAGKKPINLGLAMYEALYAHSRSQLGLTEATGDVHSSSAHGVHRKLARRHGLTYVGKPNIRHSGRWPGSGYVDMADWADAPNTDSDGKYDEYKYGLPDVLEPKQVNSFAEHKLPGSLHAEGYRLNIAHSPDTTIGTIHRGGDVLGHIELTPKGHAFEEWTGYNSGNRVGLRDAALSVLRGHQGGEAAHDEWNNVSKVSKPLARSESGEVRTGVRELQPGQDSHPTPHGSHITKPHLTYTQGAAAKPFGTEYEGGRNVWARNGPEESNKGRTLMVQFSTHLLQGGRKPDEADAYYDKLYSTREGYHRGADFWEVPSWAAHLGHSLPASDHYTVRDPEEAIQFMKAAGYDHVAFSALDVNKDFVRRLASGAPDQHVVVGGYTDMSHFGDLKNVSVHPSIKSFVESEGHTYQPGYDYRHFTGMKTVPRLTLSDGCRHNCTFCCVPKQVDEKSREEILQQADSFAEHLPSDLIYLNDKTFGQAKNHAMLPELYQRIKAKNPGFKGFVIQTTAAQMKRFTPEYMKAAGIKHVELGVESVNDPILKAHKKPATEAIIEDAANKVRAAGASLIPNIMVGLPGEDRETYARTLGWLQKHRDIISHVNAYNLALYDDSELGKKLQVINEGDRDENVQAKSWHTDPQAHADFAKALFGFANSQLDQPIGHTQLVKFEDLIKSTGHPYFDAADFAPTNEGIEAAEQVYHGGVADLGDSSAAHHIQGMSGYFEYRSHLEHAAHQHLGPQFPVWRSMTAEQHDAWRNGDDVGPVSVTLNPTVARNWGKLAAVKGERVVVPLNATPASIVMRGRPEEHELVIDGNQVELPPLKKADFKDHQQVGEQLGSNPGGVYQHKTTGKQYYVKFAPTNDHAHNEHLAFHLYQAAGVPTPNVSLVEHQKGKLATTSEMLPAVDLQTNEDYHTAAQHFGAHAWLANWDALVSGNTVNVGSVPHTIDAGGALQYRAMGGPKGNLFGPQVGEFHTMRDLKMNGAARAFQRLSPDEMNASVARVANISDETIDQLVRAYGPVEDEKKAWLANTLKARKQHLVAQAHAETGQRPLAKAEKSFMKGPAFRHASSGKVIATPILHDRDILARKLKLHPDHPSLYNDWEAGFIDHAGNFFNREAALAAVTKRGQQHVPKLGYLESIEGLESEQYTAGREKGVFKSEPLAKMALIHDDPKKPKAVWRVQNKAGEGPHALSVGAASPAPWAGGRIPERQPRPEVDFSRDDWRDFSSAHPDVNFGFESPEHASSWYGDSGLAQMKHSGYSLKQVLAQKVWRSKSGKQVFFKPVREREPVEVWRVENEEGRGPWAGGAPAEALDMDRIDYQTDPEHDFSPKDLVPGRKYGFESEQHAKDWFGPKGLRNLSRHGFALRRMLAEQVWRSKSGKQVMFSPARQTMAKAEVDHHDPVSCVVMVQDGLGRTLWGKRKDGKYTMPAGHADAHEHPADCAKRELMEEAGLKAEALWLIGSGNGDEGPVHLYHAISHGQPRTDLDPDREMASWEWHDCLRKPPEHITANLAHNPSIVYTLMGWEQPLSKASVYSIKPHLGAAGASKQRVLPKLKSLPVEQSPEFKQWHGPEGLRNPKTAQPLRLFHGHQGSISGPNFDPHTSGSGLAWFSAHPAMANDYAGTHRASAGSAITPAYVKGNFFDYTKHGEMEAENFAATDGFNWLERERAIDDYFGKGGEYDGVYGPEEFKRHVQSGSWVILEDRAFLSHLQDSGYDGLITHEGGYTNYGVFDPEKTVKSPFSKFNPKSTNMNKSDDEEVVRPLPDREYEKRFPLPEYSSFGPKNIHKQWKNTQYLDEPSRENPGERKSVWDLDQRDIDPIRHGDFKKNAHHLSTISKAVHKMVGGTGSNTSDRIHDFTVDSDLPSESQHPDFPGTFISQAFHSDDSGNHIAKEDAKRLAYLFGDEEGVSPKDSVPSFKMAVHEMMHGASGKYKYDSHDRRFIEEATTEVLAQHYTPRILKHSHDIDLSYYGGGHENPLVRIDSKTGETYLDRPVSYHGWVDKFAKVVAHIEGLDEPAKLDETGHYSGDEHDEKERKLSHMVAWYALKLKKMGHSDYSRSNWLKHMWIHRRLGVNPTKTQVSHPYFGIRNRLYDLAFDPITSHYSHFDATTGKYVEVEKPRGIFHHSREVTRDTLKSITEELAKTHRLGYDRLSDANYEAANPEEDPHAP